VVADYNGDAAESAAKAINNNGGQAMAVTADFGDRAQVDKAVEAARREFGPVGILVSSVPDGRVGTGDDIAAASIYLVSEEASYFTGQTVSVNGGSFVGW
jgi:NAD(P)-dependent dehydrogenase (short-subunit alcohol dehydrogenase family)